MSQPMVEEARGDSVLCAWRREGAAGIAQINKKRSGNASRKTDPFVKSEGSSMKGWFR